MPFEAYFLGRLAGGHRLDAIEDALVQLHGGLVAQVKNQRDVLSFDGGDDDRRMIVQLERHDDGRFGMSDAQGCGHGNAG